MKKTKIFLFWLGSKEPPVSINFLNSKYKSLEFIFGPTASDHKYLMSEYEYYRIAYEKKIFSFCSDVWRFYILTKNRGFYCDINTEFGPKFETYIKGQFRYMYWAIKGEQNDVGSNFIGRWGKDTKLYEKALSYYKMHSVSKENIRAFYVGPTVLTRSIWSIWGVKLSGFRSESINKEIFIDIFPNMRNRNIIYNFGSGSWIEKNGAASAKAVRDRLDKCWRTKKCRKRYIHFQDDINYGPRGLRIAFSNCKRNEKKNYKELYKNIDSLSFWKKYFWYW